MSAGSRDQLEKKLEVNVAHASYPLYIGWNNLANIYELISPGTLCLIVTDENIFNIYGDKVEKILKSIASKYNINYKWKILPPGEETKSLDMAKQLYDEASYFEMNRDSFFVALGGGVIGDLCGFVASTYMRGTRFLQVPTTLLAQVDSSVGGKVAVNHPRQKNLIGSFYHPGGVLMDLNFLKTLPARDFNAGLAEIVKSAILWDRDFFFFIKDFINKEYAFEDTLFKQNLVKIIARACEIKALIVKKDEKDYNIRQFLNLGHTFAHALEGVTGYSYFRHGEAVMWGIRFASELSHEKGILSKNEKDEICELIEVLDPPPLPPNLDPRELKPFFLTDKKRRDTVTPFIIPVNIGKVDVFKTISLKEAISIVDKYC